MAVRWHSSGRGLARVLIYWQGFLIDVMLHCCPCLAERGGGRKRALLWVCCWEMRTVGSHRRGGQQSRPRKQRIARSESHTGMPVVYRAVFVVMVCWVMLQLPMTRYMLPILSQDVRTYAPRTCHMCMYRAVRTCTTVLTLHERGMSACCVILHACQALFLLVAVLHGVPSAICALRLVLLDCTRGYSVATIAYAAFR